MKKTVAENEVKTQERKTEIESELSEIQPILDDAKQAVGMCYVGMGVSGSLNAFLNFCLFNAFLFISHNSVEFVSI